MYDVNPILCEIVIAYYKMNCQCSLLLTHVRQKKGAGNLIPPEPNSVTVLTAPLKQRNCVYNYLEKLGFSNILC